MSTSDHQVERDILIAAPMDVVWRTITEPDQIALWFADRVDLEVVPGARGHMGFGEQGGPVLVETVDPPRTFSFRWNWPAGEEPTEANSVLVAFTLAAEGEGTRLRVTEELAPLPWPDAEKQRYADEHNHGWGDFLGRLDRVHTQRG